MPLFRLGFEILRYILVVNPAQQLLSSTKLHLHMQNRMYTREKLLAGVSYVLKQSTVLG